MATSPVAIAGIVVDVFWVLVVVAAIVAIVYLVRFLKRLYDDFTGPNAYIEQQITNMFTPHQEDGTVAPKDIAPKGTDPIDWLFMDHDLAEPV